MRVRNVPHQEGNWATLVYISLDNIYLDTFIHKCMQSLKDQSLCPMEDLHISLSKTLYLKAHQITNFINALERQVQTQNFQISFSDLTTYENDERTCNFLALNVLSGKSDLLKLVNVVNTVASSFGHASYYEEPSFHTSFAWCSNRIEINPNLNSNAIHSVIVDINSINVKCGNRIYEINL